MEEEEKDEKEEVEEQETRNEEKTKMEGMKEDVIKNKQRMGGGGVGQGGNMR